MASDLAAQRAEMMAAVNATRPTSNRSRSPSSWDKPLSQMGDDELLHWAHFEGDVARRREIADEIARRRGGAPQESTTADLANETRPVPEVKTEDNGWKNGAFDWDLAKQEMAAQRAREAAGTGVNGAVQSGQYTPPAGRSNSADLDSNDAAATPLSDEKWSDEKEVRYRVRKFGVTEEQARQSLAEEKAAASRRADASDAKVAKFDRELEPIYGELKPDMSSTDVLPGDQPGTARKWNPATGRYDTVTVAKPSAPAPAPFYGRTVPGPVAVDGSPVAAPRAFASQEEADAYNTRPAKDGVPTTVGALEPSQRDIDMRARGFVPVYGKDGSVTYMLEAPAVPGTRGAPGRRGDRPELTRQSLGVNDPPVDMYEATVGTDAVPGPLGPQSVYRPTDEYKKEVATAQERREVNRLIESSGLPAETVLGAYATDGIKGARMVANAARAEAGARRREAVVRQAQLTQRPANILSNPTADDWTRRLASEALLRSGRPGATPLDVQGQQMVNTQRVREQEAVGAWKDSNDPVHAQLRAAEADRVRKQDATWRTEAWKYGEQGASGWNPFESSAPSAKRERARNRVLELGGSPQDAERIAGELYPAGAADGRVDGRQVNPQAML
jgi:hypothetical protein